MSDGWFKIHRSILDHPAFRGFQERWAFAELIGLASWKPTTVRYKDRIIKLERGQVAISIRDFARRVEWDKAKVERFFFALKNQDMIETATETGVNIITICNYCTYQDDRDRAETPTEREPRQDRDTEQEREEYKKDISTFGRSSKPNGFDPSPFVEVWNSVCGSEGISRVVVLRDARRLKAVKRWREDFGGSVERWGEFCRRVSQSDFLAGRKTDWKATFDFCLEPRNVVKINEGQYDNPGVSSGSVDEAALAELMKRAH